VLQLPWCPPPTTLPSIINTINTHIHSPSLDDAFMLTWAWIISAAGVMLHDVLLNDRGRRKLWPKFSRMEACCGEGCCLLDPHSMGDEWYLQTNRAEPLPIFYAHGPKGRKLCPNFCTWWLPGNLSDEWCVPLHIGRSLCPNFRRMSWLAGQWCRSIG